MEGERAVVTCEKEKGSSCFQFLIATYHIFCGVLAITQRTVDCGKHDPDISLELEKDMIGLLTEELNLQRNVTNDNMEHTKSAILEARKTSSQYQKEAEKCNSGMETCEEAREKAEAAIIAEHKLSAIWEDRARQHGWKDRRRTYA
ncbi:hypothetical protein GIB67_034337 [Kingdonia uniflora]|uniref:Uncharacterized protein n=1 Tax=Kingdonia uniflora TaxID=39325 RepID=A0A7J7NRX3_9MAGN|nr:hypothetical protein GIB67_034337 [Kingdonia uniflora]